MRISTKITRTDEYYRRIEDHVTLLRALSREEQAHVRERMGWVEPGGLLEAEIIIHDTEGHDSYFPRVTIRHHDGTWESIDILKSIESNASSIGHPAILLAIRLWERDIRCLQVLSKSTRGKAKGQLFDEGFQDIYTLARHHLKAVGESLLKGAASRALSKDAVFLAQTRRHDSDYDWLRLAWETLAAEEIIRIRNDEVRLTELKRRMLSVFREKGIKRRTRLSPPSEFVMRSVAKWIERVISFIREERLHQRRRLTWSAMRNRFDAWRFELKENSVKSYRSLASKTVSPAGTVGGFIRSRHDKDRSFFISDLGTWLSLPVVHAGEQFSDPELDDYYVHRHTVTLPLLGPVITRDFRVLG